MKILKWFKELPVTLRIVYITLGVCIVMFVLYFIFVRGHFSPESKEWANFGAYFGSITGLLAFAGVLYSINESSKQSKDNDERNVFFKLIDLYQQKASMIQKPQLQSETKESIFNLLQDYTILLIIYIHINTEEELIQLDNTKDQNTILFGINSCFGKEPYEFNPFESEKKMEEKLKLNIEYLFSKVEPEIAVMIGYNFIKVPENFKSDYKLYKHWALTILAKSKNFKSKYSNFCYKVMNKVSNLLDNRYEYILGQYYRNVHSILEFSFNSTKQEFYTNFFRSQVSSSELIILFYYSANNKVTSEELEYFKKTYFFKYLNPADCILYQFDPSRYSKMHIPKEMKKHQFINDVLSTCESKQIENNKNLDSHLFG